MSKFDENKQCRILLDWILSHDSLSCRDIHKQLIIMGFDYPSNLAFAYAFILSVYQRYKNNENVQRLIVCLYSMIIDQYMEFYNFYPCFDSSGLFGYSSSRIQDFE